CVCLSAVRISADSNSRDRASMTSAWPLASIWAASFSSLHTQSATSRRASSAAGDASVVDGYSPLSSDLTGGTSEAALLVATTEGVAAGMTGTSVAAGDDATPLVAPGTGPCSSSSSAGKSLTSTVW